MSKKIKRGQKQLIALNLLNGFPDDGVYEELTGAVIKACFSDELRVAEGLKILSESDKESNARHLLMYLVRNQHRKAQGKKVTLQEQGRIVTDFVNDEDTFHLDAKGLKVWNEEYPNAGKGRIILKGPTTRKKPVFRTVEEREKVKTMPAERLAAFRQAQRSLSAKRAAQRIEEMAMAGAHNFTGEVVTQPAPVVIENHEVESERA
jgi:hypothetical protein